ncbi:MAG: hypothetical protein ACE5EA_01170 [Nitrospirota bacterium]
MSIVARRIRRRKVFFYYLWMLFLLILTGCGDSKVSQTASDITTSNDTTASQNNDPQTTDKSPPANIGINTKDGLSQVEFRCVDLIISGEDGDLIVSYFISEDLTGLPVSSEDWIPIKNEEQADTINIEVPFTLSKGDGEKKIYLWLMDRSGNRTEQPAVLTINLSLVHQKWGLCSVASGGEDGWDRTLAVDPNDNLHIVFYNRETMSLFYTNNINGYWKTILVDSDGDVGWDASIGIDTADKIHLVYYDNGYGRLKYATDISGEWNVSVIDESGEVGSYTSLVIDNSNNLHVSYYDDTNGALKYANNIGGVWNTMVIDGPGDNDTNYNVGGDTSIAMDGNGNLHIVYHDEVKFDSKYATNSSGKWEFFTIDAPESGDGSDIENGWDASIAIDRDGFVHTANYDNTLGDLRYVTNRSGEWRAEVVDDGGGTFEEGGADVGAHISLIADDADYIHISYYDESNTNLKYAVKHISDTGWTVETVDTNDQVGKHTSVAEDSAGNIYIRYYDDFNKRLKYAVKYK